MLKKVFSVEEGSKWDALILVMRVAIAAMMLVHGLPKLQMLMAGDPAKFANIFGMGAELSLILAVFAEVVCSIFILFGLGTRAATIPLIITMLVAVFHVHANDPFIKQEMGLHYLLVYAVLLFAGSGKYSADYFLVRQRA